MHFLLDKPRYRVYNKGTKDKERGNEMVELTHAFCYGVVVDYEFKEKFEELLSEDESYEEWEWEDISNKYCPYLDTWTSSDCFFGIVEYIYKEKYEINSPFPSEEKLKQFYELCEKYNLLSMVKWEPKEYIIVFVS